MTLKSSDQLIETLSNFLTPKSPNIVELGLKTSRTRMAQDTERWEVCFVERSYFCLERVVPASRLMSADYYTQMV